MDQNILVAGGHALVKALDDAGLSPRAALWVHNADTDTWKLWLVPPQGVTNKRDFYRQVSEIISRHRNEFGGIDSNDTEMVLDSHPAMKGLGHFIKAPGLGSIHFSGNRFNGYYLPDGILLRVDL